MKINNQLKQLKILFVFFMIMALVTPFVSAGFGDDSDGDGITDINDNCPYDSNKNQENDDWQNGNDVLGNLCDPNKKNPIIITGDQSVDEGQTLSFEIAANGGLETVAIPVVVTIVSENLPSNVFVQDVLTLTLQTKQITFTPIANQQGVYTITVQAVDGPQESGDAVRTVQKTITITVKDTIQQPQLVNNAPIADFSWQPAISEEGEVVQFLATVSDLDPDDSVLLIAWDFDNDGSADITGFSNDVAALTPNHVFTTAGNYPVKLSVADGFGIDGSDDKSTTVTKIVTVKEKILPVNQTNQIEMTSLQCFDNVIVGNEQKCTIHVEDKATHQATIGATAVLFFDTVPQKFIGICTTNNFGSCSVTYIADTLGTFTATAIAQKQNQQTLKQNFTYTVLDHAYTIVNLGVFNSLENMNLGVEDHQYFRGEGFFIKFQVVDASDNNKLITDSDLVTKATLQSPPGGFADLFEFQKSNDGYFYYALQAIPLTHAFKGDSQVFTFAFNFKENKGGQAKVELSILNNPPKIVGEIPDMTVQKSQAFTFDLSPYESDLEDSGNDLFWAVANVDESLFTASVVGKLLTILPIKEGFDTITLTLRDLDGDAVTQDVVITVKGGNATLPLAVTINADKTIGEVPLAVQFTSAVLNAEGDVTYVWNFGDGVDSGITVNQVNPMHTFSQAGIYTVLLTIVDEIQNTATASIVIEVKEKQLPNATALILTATPTEGKAALIVKFSTEGTTASCAFTLDLDFGDASNHAIVEGSNNFAATHIYQNPGKYMATLTLNAGLCGVFTKTVTITVLDADVTEEGKSVTSRDVVDWNRLQLLTGEEYSAGDIIAVLVDFDNDGDNELQNTKITVTIPELGARKSLGPIDVNEGASFVKIIYLQLPFDAVPGAYDVMATVHGDNVGNHDEDVHRIKFRQITIR